MSSNSISSIFQENDTISSNSCTFYEWSRNPDHAQFFRIFSIISVLTVLVVVVVLGNALVIAAVLLRRRLRSATGLLILSLGVADLLVGTVILPFSIANEVLNGYWIFGQYWCTIWVTMDIWMCTASIYNLVAISIDRYIAIIKPLNYPMLVTKFRARCTVAIVWIGSFIICSPSFILASSEKEQTSCSCTPANSGTTYVLFSAFSSFYLPMIIVIFVYFRIYIAARAATKSIYSGMMQVTANANKNTKNYLLNHPNVLTSKESLPMLRVHRGSSVANIRQPSSNIKRVGTQGCNAKNGNNNTNRVGFQDGSQNDRKTSDAISNPNTGRSNNSAERRATMATTTEKNSTESETSNSSPPKELLSPDTMDTTKSTLRSKIAKSPLRKLLRRGQKKKAGCAYEKRLSLEIKAAKTVAIVTGCFIFCWLGFSIMYGFQLDNGGVVWSVVFWLGYLNSALNPVIYTVFNREFRTCFKRLLTCHHLNHPTTTKYTNNSYNSTVRPGTRNYRTTSSPPQVYANNNNLATISK